MNFDDFIAPPTPSRCMMTSSNGIDDESAVLEDGSLAVLTGEVAEAQKFQMNDLAEKEKQLNSLKVAFKQSTVEFESNQEDFNSINRKLYLLQDNSMQTRKHCFDLQNNITLLLNEKMESKKDISRLIWAHKDIQNTYLKYGAKMKRFRDMLHEYYEESDISKKVHELEKDIVEKKIQYTELESASHFINTSLSAQDVNEIESRLEDRQEENNNIEAQVRRERERLTSLKNEIDAIHKRKIAHITRLSRQVQDSNNRILQWRRDIKDIENRISENNSSMK